MRKLLLRILFFVLLLLPLWSFLTWYLIPADALNILILDKSVTTDQRKSHRSFNWILTHEKHFKNDGSPYSYSADYLGFFPEDRPELRIKDLSEKTSEQIDSLANVLNMAYYTDAKGISNEDWPEIRDTSVDVEVLYGGLEMNDYLLLEKMYEQDKLIVAEFNTLLTPTPAEVRIKMEELFEFSFSGWIGRSFKSLDHSVNPEIPDWVITKYEDFKGEEYNFIDEPGIILIHESGQVLVLEESKHLEHPFPSINTQIEYRKRLDLPDFINYPYWFDVVSSNEEDNVIATYKIHSNGQGDSILAAFDLSNKFPAIVGESDKNNRYYFCGDFANNPVQDEMAYFKGIRFISSLFHNKLDGYDRKNFFWSYYCPLMANIISNYTEAMEIVEHRDSENVGLNEVEDTNTIAAFGEEEISDSLDASGSEAKWNRKRFQVGGRKPLGDNNAYEGSDANGAETSNEDFISHADDGDKKWRIVIASLKSKEGTRRYLTQLDNPEISAVYVDYLETHRITFGPFESLGESQSKYNQVLAEYPDAWRIKF